MYIDDNIYFKLILIFYLYYGFAVIPPSIIISVPVM